jgi:serine phosphatase RsbU (regulator of sigma subunit)
LRVLVDASEEEKEAWLNRVDSNQEKMQKWAHHVPMNHLHKFYRVEAERHRVQGSYMEAMDYYDRAIAGAKENEYINEEALAHELAAKFYLEWGKQTIAQAYLTNAYYAYARWGAKAKVEDLEKRYPELLASILTQKTSATTEETIVQAITKTVTSSSTGSANSAILDLATVIKASQVLSGEVQLDKLLSTLMQVAIENAGAEKGCLILPEAGKLMIEATGVSGTKEATVLQSIPVEQSQEIPVTLINYVYRTSETLVLDDASVENTFSADPYIIGTEPRAVLCTSIINQGQRIGILYLENNLTTKAFTPDRLELLKILSAQAAISIENARLYQTLEDKVKERTAQLAQANQEISALNSRLKQENLRLSAELEVTKQLQQMILPKPQELESIEGLEIAGFMEPADEVGGDYYDVLQLDGKVKIAIGDVTGHGLESGMLMLMTQTAIRTLQESNQTDPVKFLDILNRTIYRNVERMNSSKNLTLAVVDYADSTLSLSGQHEEMIVVRAGGEVERIDTINLGFPIGLEEEIADFIATEQVHLNPGEVVVLYTDGITEAFDINQKEYGVERLCEVVSRNCLLSAEGIKQSVIDDVRRHIGSMKVFDDITLVVLKQK